MYRGSYRLYVTSFGLHILRTANIVVRCSGCSRTRVREPEQLARAWIVVVRGPRCRCTTFSEWRSDQRQLTKSRSRISRAYVQSAYKPTISVAAFISQVVAALWQHRSRLARTMQAGRRARNACRVPSEGERPHPLLARALIEHSSPTCAPHFSTIQLPTHHIHHKGSSSC